MMAASEKAPAGFVRRQLGEQMIIRYSAGNVFSSSDNNIEYGIHIASVLQQGAGIGREYAMEEEIATEE